MAATKSAIESFDFDGEEVGASAATALRKLLSLSETAPKGRMFSSISTMADLSDQAALEFETAAAAELNNESEAAESSLHRGMRLARRLKDVFGAQTPIELPNFIRRK